MPGGRLTRHRPTREGFTVMRDSPLSITELLADQPPELPDDPGLRATIRQLRTDDGRLLGILDDDPTGSQAVHDVQVVTVLDEQAYEDAFAAAAGGTAACFVLTNSRSLPAERAAALTADAARGLVAVARRRSDSAGSFSLNNGAPLDLISRSDSTLRGHVIEETTALAGVLRETNGTGPDGVLFIPAFIEAGRLTIGDVHWARGNDGMVPVGETEFARDRAFGYAASNLREFLAEKSGAFSADTVASISLADIRTGGVARIREVLAGARDGTWIVVNAATYSDLETVAHAVLLAERSGQVFLFRTGPSFVRALSGLEPRPPLRGQDLVPARKHTGRASSADHGLIVVGSHVGQTTRQLDALMAKRNSIPVIPVELDVAEVISGAPDVVKATAARVAAALRQADVVLYTSRKVVTRSAGQDNLTVARTVSAALAGTVRLALAGEPAWIIAKGGITSHDVAVAGLRIRRAEVAGQLFPGLISVFRPADAAPEAVGMPYVVFPGNVGGDDALADVVALLHDTGASH
jgi:uncharacterized protein YgbK (DUF1537 family)